MFSIKRFLFGGGRREEEGIREEGLVRREMIKGRIKNGETREKKGKGKKEIERKKAKGRGEKGVDFFAVVAIN